MDGGETHRFPCPACGSDLRYQPQADQLVCDHCGHKEAVESDGAAGGPWGGEAIRELDFTRGLGGSLPEAEMEETRVLTCPNCGATVEFEPDTHAAECPFCATPVVTGTGINRHIKPKGVLPFLLAEGEARVAMNNWLGSLWFAPSGLKAYARAGRAMQGIYAPFWTYDARTDSTYQGERGDAYYVQERVRVVRDGRAGTEMRQVRRIRWTPVRGRVARAFDDILVLGSATLPKTQADAIAPWDLSALMPYRPQYLAGFRAEAYTVPLEAGFEEARQVMNATIARDVRFDIGGDEQRVHGIDTDVTGVTFKHVLLPLWLAAYKYRGKSYRFIVNGRTGAVAGERPYSAWKIAAAVIAALIVAGIIGYLVAQGQDGGFRLPG